MTVQVSAAAWGQAALRKSENAVGDGFPVPQSVLQNRSERADVGIGPYECV